MTNNLLTKEVKDVVVRFSGDSGDGMQLAGSIFSNLEASLGNEISTFPDFPAEIRAPHGTISGVSGYQVRVGADKVYTCGDTCDVLVAMNPAALKTNAKFLNSRSIIITDTDSFEKKDLEKALYTTDDPFEELGIQNEVIAVPITTLCKESLKDSGLDNKAIVRCKNMFALGLVCWLFNSPLERAMEMLKHKFSKKPTIAEANIKVMTDGYNYGYNTHASASTYRIESGKLKEKGVYTDVNGNLATAYGLVAAAEKANLQLFLGSYPITPATDILHHLSKMKDLGVVTVQCEDEIAGCCSAIGASFAGNLAVTNTSGPGICLKSEAINLAIMAELPLVIINVQRGGPSTGLPTKSEQTDLLQALYGRNGESPIVVLAAQTPDDCFDSAFQAAKIALEHMTPVLLLTDAYVANGSSAWRIPELDTYPDIIPPYVKEDESTDWKPYKRNAISKVRQWAIPGQKGFAHRLGGLEKDSKTSAISTDPTNHELMVNIRKEKIEHIVYNIPKQTVEGDEDADLLVVGWGSTYGHLHAAISEMRDSGKKVAHAQFKFINPLPSNTKDILQKYKHVIVAEQNLGQFAMVLRNKVPGINIKQFNRVEGQPFKVEELIETFTKTMEE